jgi:hypothetical protein
MERRTTPKIDREVILGYCRKVGAIGIIKNGLDSNSIRFLKRFCLGSGDCFSSIAAFLRVPHFPYCIHSPSPEINPSIFKEMRSSLEKKKEQIEVQSTTTGKLNRAG